MEVLHTDRTLVAVFVVWAVMLLVGFAPFISREIRLQYLIPHWLTWLLETAVQNSFGKDPKWLAQFWLLVAENVLAAVIAGLTWGESFTEQYLSRGAVFLVHLFFVCVLLLFFLSLLLMVEEREKWAAREYHE